MVIYYNCLITLVDLRNQIITGTLIERRGERSSMHQL